MTVHEEQTKVEEPKGQKFHLRLNRISRLWYKAQREVKAKPDFEEMSYEEFCRRVDDQWKKLAEEQGLDLSDKTLYDEPSEMIPVDEHGKELVKTDIGYQYEMELK